MGPGDPRTKAGPGPDLAKWLTWVGAEGSIYEACVCCPSRLPSPFTLHRRCQPGLAQVSFLCPKAEPTHLSTFPPIPAALQDQPTSEHGCSHLDFGLLGQTCFPRVEGEARARPALPVSSLSYRVPAPTSSPSSSHDFSSSSPSSYQIQVLPCLHVTSHRCYLEQATRSLTPHLPRGE